MINRETYATLEGFTFMSLLLFMILLSINLCYIHLHCLSRILFWKKEIMNNTLYV